MRRQADGTRGTLRNAWGMSAIAQPKPRGDLGAPCAVAIAPGGLRERGDFRHVGVAGAPQRGHEPAVAESMEFR